MQGKKRVKTSADSPHISARTQQPNAVKRLQAIAAGAERLWQEAVAARTPVSSDAALLFYMIRGNVTSFSFTHSTMQIVIEGELKDKEWLASCKWSNDYLRSTAVSTYRSAKPAVAAAVAAERTRAHAGHM